MKSTIQISLLIVCLSLSTVFAQTGSAANLDQDEIQTLNNRLATKLLLNDGQKASLHNILTEYSKEVLKINSGEDVKSAFSSKAELVKATEKKIIAMLDEKQKMKYEIVKKEWWDSISTEEKD